MKYIASFMEHISRGRSVVRDLKKLKSPTICDGSQSLGAGFDPMPRVV